MDEVKTMAKHGITFGEPKIEIDQLREYKESIIAKLTGGLAGMAKMRKVKVVRGLGRFLDANHVEVELTNGSGQDLTGQKEVVRFQKAIIAAGSQPVKLPFLPEDPRIVDSTGALLLTSIPKRMLVIGGGIIGCSVAYHLTLLGIKDVVLLERRQLTCGTTWHAAGLVPQLRATRTLTELAKYTSELLKTLEAKTGQATGFKQNGSVAVA